MHSTGCFSDKKYTRQAAVLRPYTITQAQVTEEGIRRFVAAATVGPIYFKHC
jgi:hypothetical protein